MLGLPGALLRQENRAFGERPRASKLQTRGHGPFTEESLAGAEQERVDRPERHERVMESLPAA